MSRLDKLVTTLLDHQVHDPRFVDLVATWDRYIPVAGGEAPEALVGAYWDSVWFAESSPARIRSVDSVGICQYLNVVSHAYRDPGSAYFQDDAALTSAIGALGFCARRINTGRPLTNPCFDFGLIALAEALVRLEAELDEELLCETQRAVRDAALDLYGLYETSEFPLGSNNHQAVTGHATLQAGIALHDPELQERGVTILTENLGYFDDEGRGYEHDRKYEMIVAGTLLRAYELTGDSTYLRSARRAARYNVQFAAPSGELIELTSRRPDCAGDFTMSYALYAYHYLGSACRQGAAAEVDAGRDPGEDDCFAAVARRFHHFVNVHQRDDGLWPGFLYAMDGDMRCDKMDPFYMTGYGLAPLIWTTSLPPIAGPNQLPDLDALTQSERSLSYRRGDFHLAASGHDRHQDIRIGQRIVACGPADLFVIDMPGPGIWGFACWVLCDDGEWYGDPGGFTPRLRLDPSAWEAHSNEEGWVIRQVLDLLDDSEHVVAQLRCELTVSGTLAVLRVSGHGKNVRQWRLGPNARAALGQLSYVSDGQSEACRQLTEHVSLGDQVELRANGRQLTVSLETEQAHRHFITPAQNNNQSSRHRLVTGDIVGIWLEADGDRVAADWRIDGRQENPE